jgi:hypothetical protein
MRDVSEGAMVYIYGDGEGDDAWDLEDDDDDDDDFLEEE